MIKASLRRSLDAWALKLCGSRLPGRIVQYLSYQRKRALRRQVEARLQQAGSYGDIVQRGPFAGLKYLPLETYASCRFEKVIGAYEHEIHPWITELVATRQYATIFNIGAAEGFYTCGLAMLFPSARVLSYESTASARDYCQQMAVVNQMADRVDIRATCTPASLGDESPSGPVLVVMDVDAGERSLLDPSLIPWLKHADVLVETHECFDKGINKVLTDRFEATHAIRTIRNAGLAYGNYPPLDSLTFDEIYTMVGEDRPSLQDWLLMQPRQTT